MSNFVLDAWYPIAWVDELSEGPLGRVLLNEPVVVFKTEEGTVVALEDRCCHKFLPLSRGRVRGECIECGYHGMQYDHTGACVKIPGQKLIPANARVRSYPVARRLGLVWLWTGEFEAANEQLLFDMAPYRDAAWGVNHGPYTHVRSHYQQLTDNLLDPAHVSFVHLSTLGSKDMEEVPVETKQIGDIVEVKRWTLDKPPVPIFQEFMPIDGNVDRWQYYLFYPPSINIVDFGIGPVGMSHSDADRDSGIRIFSCHFLAPETERSTHYFWMQVRNFEPENHQVSERMTELLVMAFDEDKEILEAVQAATEAAGDQPSVRLAIDNGPNRSRRIVDKMIRNEQAVRTMAAE
ncbi:MAG: aromatic ring-hydroxylating dioxygenase subunit alpha [Rhodospirillaceae bacterium]|nr:aromatic ring-hydroxylating dioxygenase subunit alpha [Rhodospirillaceae bacterium]